MSETEKIQKLFNDLHSGEPWLDVTLTGMLKGLTASQASAKPLDNLHSSWDVVVHIMFWRTNIYRKLIGENPVKEDEPKDWDPVEDTTETAWQDTLKCLEENKNLLSQAIADTAPQRLDDIYKPNNTTFYELLHGIIQHDVYHIGQIVLIRKFI